MASIRAGKNILTLLKKMKSVFMWKKAIMMTMDKVVDTTKLLIPLEK